MIETNLAETSLVFATRIGWIGVRFCGDSVTRTTMGHRVKRQAAKAIGTTAPQALALTPCQRDIVERLQRFAEGEATNFDDVCVSLANVTKFQRSVLNHCRTLRWGETASYGTIARWVGHPGAARAVGSTMAKNPAPIIIPCHRVVSAAGLGGFSAPGGCRTKQALLDAESNSYNFEDKTVGCGRI